MGRSSIAASTDESTGPPRSPQPPASRAPVGRVAHAGRRSAFSAAGARRARCRAPAGRRSFFHDDGVDSSVAQELVHEHGVAAARSITKVQSFARYVLHVELYAIVAATARLHPGRRRRAGVPSELLRYGASSRAGRRTPNSTRGWWKGGSHRRQRGPGLAVELVTVVPDEDVQSVFGQTGEHARDGAGQRSGRHSPPRAAPSAPSTAATSTSISPAHAAEALRPRLPVRLPAGRLHVRRTGRAWRSAHLSGSLRPRGKQRARCDTRC